MSDRLQQQKCRLPFKKYNVYRNEEDDDGCSPEQRKKGWCSFRDNLGKKNSRYEDCRYKLQYSHLQEDYGNRMRDVQKDLHKRYAPYTTERKRRVNLNNEGCMQITVWKNKNPLKGNVGENTQDGTLGSWFKITIPYGRKYDKTWLMNSIQSHCSVPFTPVDFHYVRHCAQFFVQDASTASALRDVSYKIFDDNNQKIPIFVNNSTVPYSVRDKLEPREMEELKLTMKKRYDISLKALDLQNLRYDPDLVGLDIDIILNRRNYMAATLQIIKENFPELLSLNLRSNKLYQLKGLSELIQIAPTVKILNLSRNELKSVCELEKMKELKLEELWLDGNPLCSTFPDQSNYISLVAEKVASLAHVGIVIIALFPVVWMPLGDPTPYIYFNFDLKSSFLLEAHMGHHDVTFHMTRACLAKRKNYNTINHSFLFLVLDSAIKNCFPNLLRLDGQVLPQPVTIDIDSPHLTQPCKETCNGSEALKNLVMQFLQEYYVIYDSGNRQGLLAAYHDEACFSLTIPFNPEDPAPISLFEYFKNNRNGKILKDPYLRVQLLKYTKQDIVCSLCMLPKTQHDLHSFMVDMWFQTERMLCFSVNGVFKEEGMSQVSLRAFSRTFIATPGSISGLCVVNDELFVRDITPKTQNAYSIYVPTPISSSGPSLSQEQQEMVQASSTQSGMSPQCPQK